MVADTYRPERDISDDYRSTVSSWLRGAGELFVVLRYLRAGGAKEYAFIRNDAEFDRLLHVCPVGTDIVVFRDPQLPLRGTVDAAFIDTATERLKEWKEYLFVVLPAKSADDPRLRGEMGDRRTLVEDLSEYTEQNVAIGACPSFSAPDNESMISRSKGGIDGPR